MFFLDKPASVSLVFRSPGEFFIPKGFSHYEAWENTISGQAVCYALSVLMTVVFHDFGGLLFLVRLKRSSKGWFGPGLQALHSGSRLPPLPSQLLWEKWLAPQGGCLWIWTPSSSSKVYQASSAIRGDRRKLCVTEAFPPTPQGRSLFFLLTAAWPEAFWGRGQYWCGKKSFGPAKGIRGETCLDFVSLGQSLSAEVPAQLSLNYILKGIDI